MSLIQSDSIPGEPGRTTPRLAYILYILGVCLGVTSLIAVILAYGVRGRGGPVAQSHLNWIIATFWKSLALFLLGVLLVLIGVPLAVFGVGFWLMWTGLAIWALIAIWSLLRCACGLYHLAHGQPYPRPDSLLI